MSSTFTFNPDKDFTAKVTPNVTVASFGDGYSQRIQEGINNLSEELSLVFSNRTVAEAQSIVTFLETMAGVTSFYFTPPGDSTPKLYICSSWESSYVSHLSRTVSCTFTRVYA